MSSLIVLFLLGACKMDWQTACYVSFVLWCQECTYYMSLEGPHSAGGAWFSLSSGNLVPFPFSPDSRPDPLEA